MQTKTTRLFTLPTLTLLFMGTTENVRQMMYCVPKTAVFAIYNLTNHLKNKETVSMSYMKLLVSFLCSDDSSYFSKIEAEI